MPPSTPLQTWKVEGFKSIASADVEFRPLTVVVGSNSTGKSSLLQSILLAAQAALVASRGPVLPMHGPLVSVGSFSDTVFAVGKKRTRIVLGGQFVLAPRRRGRAWQYAGAAGSDQANEDEIGWEVQLAGAPRDDPGASRIRRIELTRSVFGELERSDRALRLEATMTREGALDGRLDFGGLRLPVHDVLLHAGLPAAYLVQRPETEVLFEQWMVAAASTATRARSQRSQQSVRQPDDVTDLVRDLGAEAVFDLSSFTVERPNATMEESEHYFTERWEMRTHRNLPVTLLTSLADELRNLVIGQLGKGSPRWVEPDSRRTMAVVDAASRLRDFLRGVNYLGPLREEPKAVYSPAPNLARGSVGTRGEYVIAQLHAFGDQPVSCPLPDGEVAECPLLEAVAAWLDDFDVGESISTRNLGRFGLEPRLRDRFVEKELDLTSVGVGVSQVLPVVVQCLAAQSGSLTLIEQPELHLNPAVQQRLGDFFVACVRSGRQLLVETHSDHLVSRLRRRIAEDPGDDVQGHIRILFAERFGGETSFRVIEPNEFGGIEDWPEGFFDQGATEAQDILRAALAKHERTTS